MRTKIWTKKDLGFYQLQENLVKNMVKNLETLQQKQELKLQTASKTVVQKTAETTDDLIGNKTADKITLVKKDEIPSQEIFIPTEKRQQIMIHD